MLALVLMLGCREPGPDQLGGGDATGVALDPLPEAVEAGEEL